MKRAGGKGSFRAALSAARVAKRDQLVEDFAEMAELAEHLTAFGVDPAELAEQEPQGGRASTLICARKFLHEEAVASRKAGGSGWSPKGGDPTLIWLAQNDPVLLENRGSRAAYKVLKNRQIKATHALGIEIGAAEALAGTKGETNSQKDFAERCRSAASSKALAPGQILGEAEDLEYTDDLAQCKPRDRERARKFSKNPDIKVIAEEEGVEENTIRESLVRIAHGVRKEKRWKAEHPGLEHEAQAPVCVEKNGQTGWDLEGMGVQS
jgi:hypothetical protein